MLERTRPTPARSLITRPALLLALLLSPLLVACTSGQTIYDPSGDPLLDLRNPNLRADQRVDAVDAAWSEVLGGVRGRGRTRQIFKDLAWSVSTPPTLREAALERLLRDPDPTGESDARRLAALMLPREPDADAVTLISTVAADRGWADLTPSLVRSLSRSVGVAPLLERPELEALKRLHPGEPAEDIVFDVFLGVGEGRTDAAALALQNDLRLRADAWALLSSLDPGGGSRNRLIDTAGASTPEARALIEDLRACRRDLACLPSGAQELLWLRRLRRADDPTQAARNADWWREASAAVRTLGAEARDGLELRHAEAIRWAATARPQWLTASRPALISELGARLEGREVNRRRERVQGAFGRADEKLSDWTTVISWGDVLTTLVIDEAMQTADVRTKLFTFAELDRDDRRTEYGGVIEAADSLGEPFQMVLYRPRERDRTSDTRFVASDDMIRLSDRALAHYHMQVQTARNGSFAGPSLQDLIYAGNTGRSCLVFTSLDRERIGLDCYFPSGVVLDLGEIRDPRRAGGR